MPAFSLAGPELVQHNLKSIDRTAARHAEKLALRHLKGRIRELREEVQRCEAEMMEVLERFENPSEKQVQDRSCAQRSLEQAQRRYKQLKDLEEKLEDARRPGFLRELMGSVPREGAKGVMGDMREITGSARRGFTKAGELPRRGRAWKSQPNLNPGLFGQYNATSRSRVAGRKSVSPPEAESSNGEIDMGPEITPGAINRELTGSDIIVGPVTNSSRDHGAGKDSSPVPTYTMEDEADAVVMETTERGPLSPPPQALPEETYSAPPSPEPGATLFVSGNTPPLRRGTPDSMVHLYEQDDEDEDDVPTSQPGPPNAQNPSSPPPTQDGRTETPRICDDASFISSRPNDRTILLFTDAFPPPAAQKHKKSIDSGALRSALGVFAGRKTPTGMPTKAEDHRQRKTRSGAAAARAAGKYNISDVIRRSKFGK